MGHLYGFSIFDSQTPHCCHLGPPGGGTLDEESMRIRLDKDLVYVRKQSLLFDLQIVFETLKQMLHLKTNAH